MQTKLRLLFYVDVALAFATIGYGAWTSSAWIVGAGVVGLVVALLKPAQRVARFVERNIRSKSPTPPPVCAEPADAAASATTADFSHNPPYYSAVRPMRNPHNGLNASGIVDFASAVTRAESWQ